MGILDGLFGGGDREPGHLSDMKHCPFCPKGFMRRESLEQHMRQDHGV